MFKSPLYLISFLVTLVVMTLTFASFTKPFKSEGVYIVVIKHDYEIRLYDANDTWLASYPCVFGNKDLGDKLEEGDRRTPEGVYHIILKKVHPKWDRFLGLDYPTAEDIEKFNERKAKGIIPENAKIGGSIGIHGTWPHEDFAVDQYQNWTQGCVCTKNEYIEELYKKLPVGTTVIIQK